MRKIDLYKQPNKFLSNLPAKQLNQIVLKIERLKSDPLPNDSIRLKGFPMWRVSIGEYRIIYNFDDLLVNIIIIDKRNDSVAYKKIKRL